MESQFNEFRRIVVLHNNSHFIESSGIVFKFPLLDAAYNIVAAYGLEHDIYIFNYKGEKDDS